MIGWIMAAAWGAPLQLSVTGAPDQGGQVVVRVWCAASDWLDAESACAEWVAPVGAAVTEFRQELAPGTYAIAAFHDGDGDRVMRVGWPIPIPKDPVGVTHNVRSRFGPPSWSAAAFVVADEPVVLQVLLVTP